jgi:hypothetical protein
VHNSNPSVFDQDMGEHRSNTQYNNVHDALIKGFLILPNGIRKPMAAQPTLSA